MSLQRAFDTEPDRTSGEPSTAHAFRPHASQRIEVWDLPLRIFHWSLVAAVGTAIVTGQLGGDWMAVHGKAGLAIIGLLVFRLTWGLWGHTHARFAHFAPTPARIKAYLQGAWQGLGHNPLGALSVFALLGVLAVQAGSGLFTNDEIAFSGPLAALVDEALSLRLTGLHRVLANGLFALLGLHILAIVFYVRVKKDNLVQPMITGWKDVDAAMAAPRRARPAALIASLLLAALAVYAAHGSWQSAPAPAPASASATTSLPSTPTSDQVPAPSGPLPVKAAPAW